MEIGQSIGRIDWQERGGHMKRADQYEEPMVMELENAIVRVYRPILTDDEQARRMKRIEQAAMALLRETIETKRGGDCR